MAKLLFMITFQLIIGVVVDCSTAHGHLTANESNNAKQLIQYQIIIEICHSVIFCCIFMQFHLADQITNKTFLQPLELL